MVLVDLSQVLLSSIFAQMGSQKEEAEINLDLIRHIALNNIRSYKQKYGEKYGRLVICVDSRSYWRKDIFPYYKANRKKDREKSGLDWKKILDAVYDVRTELEQFFPYQVIEVPKAEADDVIGVLCKRKPVQENTLILSGDKDFVQLQKFKGVSQYSPIQAKWLRSLNPEIDKKLHIMQGDKGDGIPNFLSADDVLVKEERQKPLNKKKLDLWCSMDPERFCTSQMLRGYRRNEALIDLEKIPPTLEEEIMDKFRAPYHSGKELMFDYFVRHRMKHLLECIGEF